MKLGDFLGKLDRLRLRTTLNRVGAGSLVVAADTEISQGLAAVLGLVAAAAARKPVTDPQLDLIVERFGTSLKDRVEHLDLAARTGKLPVVPVSILDSTFAVAATSNEILDLRTGDLVTKLPTPPIEIVSYDLVAIAVSFLRDTNDARRAVS